jgi:hypothetical protein
VTSAPHRAPSAREEQRLQVGEEVEAARRGRDASAPGPALNGRPVLDQAERTRLCQGLGQRRRRQTGARAEVLDRESVAQAQRAFADRPHDLLDGLTVDLGEAWFNLRPSNTEPLLRLNVEAGTAADMESVVLDVLAALASVGVTTVGGEPTGDAHG